MRPGLERTQGTLCASNTELIQRRAASFRLPHGESAEPSPTLPIAPPSTTLSSFHLCQHMLNCARAASPRVSTFTAGCLLGSTGSRPTVFFLRKKKKKVEPCNYKADALVWLLLFFCPNSTPPTHPHPATPRLLLPSSGIVNVWVLPRRRRLVGSLTAHRCCIKHRHANNSFLTVEWK